MIELPLLYAPAPAPHAPRKGPAAPAPGSSLIARSLVGAGRLGRLDGLVDRVEDPRQGDFAALAVALARAVEGVEAGPVAASDRAGPDVLRAQQDRSHGLEGCPGQRPDELDDTPRLDRRAGL